ncbi:phage major capsid protein [Brevibacillus brevis]|uniref:phage major capsid protein n=1 Tax=Brevibacillus brevis TaxID=1393 RepID=UPI00115AB993|nr:phage major capsid protein [Lysinibacillus sp. SDF0063]TQR29399.1 phage major capsid protein [Lysinibacillus sp. SDF0063]
MKQTNSNVLSLNFTQGLQFFSEPTLQDLLQARAAKIERQGAILEAAKADNNRDLTNEEDQEFDALETDIVDLDNKIASKEKQTQRENTVAARSASIQNQTVTPYRPSAVLGGNPTQPEPKNDNGFASLGEFINAVRFGDTKGRLAEVPVGQGEGGGYKVPDAFRAQILPSQVLNQWSMGTGGEGGYAVPVEFRPDVLMISPEAAIVRSRATVIPAGEEAPDTKITMPALDQGTKGVFGGVEVSWIGEGEEKPDTGGSLKEVALQPHEVAATTVVTDKLLRNWSAADSFIRSLLTKAMMAAEDIAYLTGNGTNKPTGVVGAAGSLAVNRATANTVTYDDIVLLLAYLLPDSASSSIWVANQSIMPDLVKLRDPAGNYIFIQGNATKGIPATLLGIPIRFTGKTPAKGQKGDLVLVDLSYYLIKDGSGPYIAASEHVYFKQNKTVIKAFWNVDGKPWVIAPLTLEDGVTKVSPYVVLDIPKV